MMDEMNVLNAPKKVVDGLTEVFEGLAQMFEGVSDQLELLGADAVPEDKRIFPIVDQEAPAVSEKKGAAASHPRKKPIKKTRKVEEASDKLEEPVTDSNSDATADIQPDAENSAGEAEEEENFPADDADALPWGEDTGQVKETGRKDEPPDKTKQSDKQFSVTEICRIFRVPPHLVADLSRATFSNIEYQSLNFVMHSLTPWLVRIEQGIIKDLLLEEEQDTYFPKFNVDGLLRGDYQSRMNGYATGISNGFLSPNDVHRLENMDLIPAEEGGDDYYLNGGYVKLKDAGVAQQNKAAAGQQNQPKETQLDPEEEPDSDNRLSESKPRKNGRRTR